MSQLEAFPFVTVVMPVRNEGSFIQRSLGAVLQQDYPASRLEVIVADGQSTDSTVAYVQQIAAEDARVRCIENPGRIVSVGMNRALGQARGDIIVRVDGHCEIAPDYVRRCVEHLVRGSAEGVGGPIETLGDTPTAKAISLAMSSKFGVGGSAFRTVKDKQIYADTVPFPAYTRATVAMAGPYDEELVRNQDDEYNYRLRKLGARLLLTPEVQSRYYARTTWKTLWRQYRQYGFWKVRVMQKHPAQMRVRQLVPAAFVVALVLAGVLAALTPVGKWLAAALIGSYAVASLLASFQVASREGLAAVVRVNLAFVLLHLGYGIGFLTGLVWFARRWHDKSTRAPCDYRFPRDYGNNDGDTGTMRALPFSQSMIPARTPSLGSTTQAP